MKKLSILIFPLLLFSKTFCQTNSLPKGFVYVKELIPNVMVEMRYAGKNNFMGDPVPGYKSSKAILSKPAAEALKKVQQDLENDGLQIKIFDAYRPQRAVDHFKEWALRKDDTLMKQKFYPQVSKNQLFNLGYLASRSGHSRGSTVDLTIIDVGTGKEVDMGSPYDFFGTISNHNSPLISETQKTNRELLKKTMMKYGFRPYTKEWWHYTYEPEPFPETYFDFVIE